MSSESKRIAAVKRFDAFSFDINENFHAILKLTSGIFNTPVAFITLLDNDHQWFKVNHGFDVLCMPRKTSFCTHVIRSDNTMVVTDARTDTRFDQNPLVANPPHIRFYAGAPLCTYDGLNIGTLCVMDVVPKSVDDKTRSHLSILARQVINLMELELAKKMITEKMQQIESRNQALRKIAHIQSHDFRGPLASVIGVMNMIREQDYDPPKEYLHLMEQAISKLDEKVHVVVRSTEIARSGFIA
jgi:GAF domain-containing protein